MPHKHKRKRDHDASNFDLDPTITAKPLPAYKPASVFSEESSNKRRRSGAKSSVTSSKDDTPKAFARMMAWQATGKWPAGLDDGYKTRKPRLNTKKPDKALRSSEKAEQSSQNESLAATSSSKIDTSSSANTPKILPGESLSQFAARVDQSLPFSTLAKSTPRAQNIPSDIKPQARVTKHNKRLQRMIADWRETDAKLKEKREEEDDDLENKEEEEQLMWDGVRSANLNRKGKKKNKGKSTAEDDPWRDLEKKRREATKQKNLQDVVQAPPTLIKVKSKFKMKDTDLSSLGGPQGLALDNDVGVDVQNVPNAVGSLRRREEMGKKRREVIEGYRKLQGKRLKGTGLSHPLPRSITTQ